MDKSGKRNPQRRITAPDGIETPPHGVGVRQERPRATKAGGGYQNICNKNERDLTGSLLDELRALGLQRAWLSVAAHIGVNNFLVMWRVLCDEVDTRGDMQRVYVPRFRTYLRFQRNRVIMALSSEGKDSRAIRTELKASTGEVVSETHIDRIIKHHRRASENGN